MRPLRCSKRKRRGELSLEICGVRFPVIHHEMPLKYLVSHSRLCWTPSAWSLLPHELSSWMGAEMSTNTDKTLWNPPKKPCLQCSFSHGLGLQTKHPLCLWHLTGRAWKTAPPLISPANWHHAIVSGNVTWMISWLCVFTALFSAL